MTSTSTAAPPAPDIRIGIRQIVRGTASYFVASAANSLSLFAVSIVISWYLGQEGLGTYAMCFVGITIMSLVGDLGIDSLVTRSFSATHRHNPPSFKSLLILRGLASVAVVFISWIVVAAVHFPSGALFIAASCIVLPKSLSGCIESYLKAKLLRRVVVRVNLGIAIASVLGVALVLHAGLGLMEVFGVILTIEILRALLLGRTITETLAEGASLRKSLTMDTANILRQSIPFALLGVFSFITARSDVVLLGVLRGSSEAGVYAAAERFLLVGGLFTFSLYGSALPILSSITNSFQHARTVRRAIGYALILCLPITLFLIAFAPLLIDTTFHFLESVELLRILSLSFAPLVINTILGTALFSVHQERTLVLVAIVVCVLSVAANLLLIPAFGAVAAAALSVVVELGMTLTYAYLYFVRVKQYTFSSPFETVQ